MAVIRVGIKNSLKLQEIATIKKRYYNLAGKARGSIIRGNQRFYFTFNKDRMIVFKNNFNLFYILKFTFKDLL